MLAGGASRSLSVRIMSDLPVPEEVINSFTFDPLALNGGELESVALYMFERYDLLKEFDVPLATCDAFVRRVRAAYHAEPRYHTWHHGVDVMHTVYQLLSVTNAGDYMSKLEFFAILISALAHDVGHPGVNNAFLVRTKA